MRTYLTKNELHLLDEVKNLEIAPKFYTREQYNKIFAIPKDNKSYYGKYLKRTILALIKATIEFDEVLPSEFKRSLDKSKYKLMLSNYSYQELSEMKLYKVIGLDIGFAIKNGNEIVNLFNNSELK